MATESRIETLFSKYLDETITREEFNEFWILMSEQDIKTLSPQLQNLWIRTEGIAPIYSDEEWNRKLKTLIQKAEEEDERRGHKEYTKNTKIIRLWKLATAACIILLVGTVTFLAISKRGEKPPVEIAKTNDVTAPSNTRAVITLADGSKVYLDSASNGTIAQENNVAVLKNANGEIVYNANSEQRTAISPAFNTLFNPRGSKVISLTLSDGTRVWLNSESSLKYPIAFDGNSREVEITGEAYFEVKHNSKQPFKVHLPNGSVVEDLGTAFNINAYADEQKIKTTLVEGSLAVSLSLTKTAAVRKVLIPGQQAIVSLRQAQTDNRSGIQVTTDVDLEEVTAWKNGSFSFNRTNIVSIMKQVERWYDVQVEFKDDVRNNDFTGGIARTENVSQVLKLLEKTGVVHFKIEGKKISVTK